MDPIHVAIPLDGTAEDAPTVRAAARTALRRAGCDEDLVGDTLLCLSELVTNALLHAGGSICVEITATAAALRVEVTDGVTLSDSPDLPASAAARASFMGDAARETGRGLAIVEQLSHAWGVAATVYEGRPAKKVWAELVASPDDAPLQGRPDAPDPAVRGRSGGGSEVTEAELVDVPIRLYLASETHLEALLRDMQLLAADWRSRNDPLVKRLAEALRRNSAARVASMEAVRRRVEEGGDVITLRFPVTTDTPAGARDFLEAVTLSEARTGRGDEDTSAAAELRHFRRWYVAELTHQALGGAPRRCPFRP